MLPVFISVDSPDGAAIVGATYTVPFPLLSDQDGVVHEAFRVLRPADEADIERLSGFGIDVEAWSGRTHHRFAIPSMFLVGRDGTVLWAHAEGNHRVRPSVDQVLAAISAAHQAANP